MKTNGTVANGIDIENSTTRLEAFSDGVFSIALTILVLDLRVPKDSEVRLTSLAASLLAQWPVYAAYGISFFTILVTWINHHRLFRVIKKTDHSLLIFNGIVLMFVSVVPFSTSLLAEHIRGDSARLAAFVYCGEFEMVSLSFHLLWKYARKGDRLFTRNSDRGLAKTIDDQYRLGPYFYLLAAAGCLLSPWVGFGICLALAIFFALPASPVKQIK